MPTQSNPKTINPLSLKPESYDILTMLRFMDQHLEAREYEKKFHVEMDPIANVKPGVALQRHEVPAAVPKIKILKTQLLKGRKIIRRVLGAKRFSFAAKVLLHKNDRYVKGNIVNISKSGVFIKTELEVFKENEVIRLYIRPKGMKKAYQAIATVMRFNEDPRYPKGYGLKFVMPA